MLLVALEMNENGIVATHLHLNVSVLFHIRQLFAGPSYHSEVKRGFTNVKPIMPVMLAICGFHDDLFELVA